MERTEQEHALLQQHGGSTLVSWQREAAHTETTALWHLAACTTGTFKLSRSGPRSFGLTATSSLAWLARQRSRCVSGP